MQQTTHTQTTPAKTTPPRKGVAIEMEADELFPGYRYLFPPASPPTTGAGATSASTASAGTSITPDLRFAIALLHLGELEGARLNQAAARDEWPATWSDDPQLKLIGDIAAEQPRALCDALMLLLDGWHRHCQTAQTLATPEE